MRMSAPSTAAMQDLAARDIHHNTLYMRPVVMSDESQPAQREPRGGYRVVSEALLADMDGMKGAQRARNGHAGSGLAALHALHAGVPGVCAGAVRESGCGKGGRR